MREAIISYRNLVEILIHEKDNSFNADAVGKRLSEEFKPSLNLFAKLSPSPSSNWAVAGSIPSFSVRPASRPAGRPTLRNSTFQAENDLDLKGKVVSLNG